MILMILEKKKKKEKRRENILYRREPGTRNPAGREAGTAPRGGNPEPREPAGWEIGKKSWKLATRRTGDQQLF